MAINYKSISRCILEKYKHFKKFRFLSQILDLNFRMAEYALESESERKIIVSRFWFLGGLYKIILLLLSLFDALSSQEKKIFVSLPRHKDLINLISSSLGEQYVIDANNLKKNYCQYLSASKVFIYRWVGCGIAQILTRQSFLARNKKTLDAHAIRIATNLFLRYEVYFYSIILRALSIKLLCLSGTSVYQSKILALAAKKANIKVITIAHGYAYGQSLLTYFPAIEDVIFVYSSQQKNFIGNLVSYKERKKIKVLGWPFPKKKYYLDRFKYNRVLFVATDCFNQNAPHYKNIRMKTLKAISDLAIKYNLVEVLLHPSERKYCEQIQKKYLTKKKVHFLNKDPVNYNYCLILGNSSTKLVEYAYSGLEVFQLHSTCVSEMEGVGIFHIFKSNNNVEIDFSKPSLKIDDSLMIQKFQTSFFNYLALELSKC